MSKGDPSVANRIISFWVSLRVVSTQVLHLLLQGELIEVPSSWTEEQAHDLILLVSNFGALNDDSFIMNSSYAK